MCGFEFHGVHGGGARAGAHVCVSLCRLCMSNAECMGLVVFLTV